ncbi:MAG TPA: histidine kinase [Kofleriaceae bacterium]|nr:histidine kinase [Kofleriaceae bacterium]
MRSRWRALAVAAGLCLAVGAATGLLLALSQGETSTAVVGRSIAIALLYTALIGVPVGALMDPLFHGLRRRAPLLRWSVVAAVLIAVTAIACALVGLLLVALGAPPATYWPRFVYSARVALVIGVIITISATFWERLRRRVDESQLAEARASELAAEARLNALEARVHPHFLFNTLNSVLSLIPDDPARAEQLLEKLAGLLRFSLDAGRRGLIPLGDELRIVGDYLDIESARLGERLRADVEVEPGLESWLVPPFAVQTLVENSVRHAIAPRRAGGAVRVRARRAGDRLELSVWDDGDGFSRAELRPGHGLENLESRLGVLFAGHGGLTLERADRGGMAVTVAVPP